jgi:hypothetical protein
MSPGPTKPPLIQYLYDAVSSEYGIVVVTDDPERLRQKLYPLRKQDELFECLSFVISPLNNQDLWIVRNPNGQG